MDLDVEGKTAPGHSKGQVCRRQDNQEQPAMGHIDTHCHQRWTDQMELVWSPVHVGSIRLPFRETRVSHCVGLSLYHLVVMSTRKVHPAGASSWITSSLCMVFQRTQSIQPPLASRSRQHVNSANEVLLRRHVRGQIPRRHVRGQIPTYLHHMVHH